METRTKCLKLSGIVSEVRGLVDRDPALASRRADEAMAEAAGRKDLLCMAAAMTAKGVAARNLGRYSEALDLIDRAGTILEEVACEDRDGHLITNRTERIRVLLHLGRHTDATGEYDEVLPVIQGYPAHRPWLEMNTGVVFAKLGAFEQAERLLRSAEAGFEHAGECGPAALARANLATVCLSLDRIKEAGDLLTSSAGAFARLGMYVPLAKVNLERSYLAERGGRPDRCLSLLADCVSRFEDLGMETETLLARLHAAETSLSLNLIAESIREASEAASGFERLGMAYTAAVAKAAVAKALFRSADISGALRLAQESRCSLVLLKADRQVAEIDRDVAEFLLIEGRYREAAELARRASVSFRREGLSAEMVRSDLVLAEVYRRQGELHRAEAMFLRLRQEASSRRLHGLLARIDHALGRLAAQEYKHGSQDLATRRSPAGPGHRDGPSNGVRRALAWYSDSIQTTERLRTALGVEDYRIAFNADRTETYEDAAAAALQTGDVAAAFRFVEMAKSRTLLESMQERRQPRRTRGGADIEELRVRLGSLYRRCEREGCNREIEQAITAIEDRLTSLARLRQGEKRSRKRCGIIGIGELQCSLDQDECLMEYAAMPGGRLALFVVQRDSCDVVELKADRSSAEAVLCRWRFGLEQFSFGDEFVRRHSDHLEHSSMACLSELYQMLVEPAESLLGQSSRLLFVPHGILHGVPFHALFDGELHVGDRYCCSLLPCASILGMLPSRSQRLKEDLLPKEVRCGFARDGDVNAEGLSSRNLGALVAGVPDDRTPALSAEIHNLAHRLSGHLLFGKEATVENVVRCSKEAGLLHIACHGLLRTDNPSFSALLLHDGRWTARDIAECRLDRVSLVVLSACFSGTSRVLAGDELIGLIRGFLTAGAGSVVASLWHADDRSTSELMMSFYDYYAASGDVPKALSQAQAELRSRFGHPYYWAPFFAVGR